MAESIKARIATESDIPEILEILKAALGETPLLQRTDALFRWKHYENPFGKSVVMVAQAGDRLAGVRALMRWELLTSEGETIQCVRAVDTATHPEFGRQGVFRTLTESAIEVARDSGVRLVFNTPNEQSGPGYLKMGWKEVGYLGAYLRPRLGPSLKVDKERYPALGDSLPGISPFVVPAMTDRPARGLRTKRDPAYLHWRFNEHPTAHYGLVPTRAGGVVARASRRGLKSETRIADVLGDADATTVKAIVRANRSRFVTSWFSAGSPEEKYIRRAGLRRLPGVKTLRLVARELAPISVDVFDLGSWDFAMSDLELL